MHNNLSSQFNELKRNANAKGEENTRLKKKVEDMQATLSARETELEEVRSRAEHYEDKSMSMKLFTTVKV